MKKSLIIGALLLGAVTSSQAQSTNASVTIPTFFTSAEQYLTSFNTNYTFTGVSFEMATGYKQVTGVGAASVIDAQYDINRFHIAASGQFSGVGSSFNALEGGVGYDLVNYYDTVLEANLLLGYDWNQRSGEVEPKIDIKKKMTLNTFTEIGISMPEYFTQKANATPSYYIEAGFTF